MWVERERVGTEVVGRREGTCSRKRVAAREVGITAATLWPFPLFIGLGGVGVLKIVSRTTK